MSACGSTVRDMRWRIVAVIILVAGLAAAGVTVAYLRRIAPPWPATEGQPYTIALDGDGCPVIPEPVSFVDSPGQLVPDGPAEVVLCALPTGLVTGALTEPKVQVLSQDTADFAKVVNALPDRNTAWRQWQRAHSGWWPDAPRVSVCPAIGYAYDYAFVLKYADGTSVPLIDTCATGGITTGARTRVGSARGELRTAFLNLTAQ
jgi:hypothetical protein